LARQQVIGYLAWEVVGLITKTALFVKQEMDENAIAAGKESNDCLLYITDLQ